MDATTRGLLLDVWIKLSSWLRIEMYSVPAAKSNRTGAMGSSGFLHGAQWEGRYIQKTHAHACKDTRRNSESVTRVSERWENWSSSVYWRRLAQVSKPNNTMPTHHSIFGEGPKRQPPFRHSALGEKAKGWRCTPSQMKQAHLSVATKKPIRKLYAATTRITPQKVTSSMDRSSSSTRTGLLSTYLDGAQ